MPKQTIFNWGRYPKIEADLVAPAFLDRAEQLIKQRQTWIARGNGRCYGDAGIQQNVLSTLNWNKILAFDAASGEIVCQSGVLLSEVIQFALPKGFFLPVTPGTKFISVGGAIAADIHGKNHHVDGTFIDHVSWFEIIVGEGEIMKCSPSENAALFWATAGAMGLTGVITKVAFKLKSVETAYIKQRNIKARNLAEIMDLFNANTHYTYSVAWLDCLQKGSALGRSILMLGEHATQGDLTTKQQRNPLNAVVDRQLQIPEFFPSFALNNLSIKAFNALFYGKQLRQQQDFIGHYNPYFYPLDALLDWNRMYGKAGFTQYQFVLPTATSEAGLTQILKEIISLNLASFLTVLKLFGKSSHPQYLSFPTEGYTLALDFKITADLFEKLAILDDLVASFGGRIYLAKDVRMSAAHFENTYPNLDAFKKVMAEYNPKPTFESLQSQRLKL